MKKILWVVILLGLSWSIHPIAGAETGFQLEKASLDSVWSETDSAWMTAYQLSAAADWEWLKLGLTGRMDGLGSEDSGSTLKLLLDFPKWKDRLGLDTQYTWDARYRILNTGVSYSRDFGEHWQVGLSYENEQKDGFTMKSAQYSRQVDQGSVSLGVEYEPWRYQIKYLGQINDYLNAPDNCFIQTELQQEISRSFGKNLRFILYYQEKARDFTVDYLSNSWEAKYGFQGNWKASEIWQWSWDYYWLNREAYNLTEDRQNFKLELESVFDENNKLVTQFRASDCRSEFDVEYEALIQEDDPKAGLPPAAPTRKLAVQYLHRFSNCSLGVGGYYSQEDQLNRTVIPQSGIFGSFDWKYQQLNLTLQASSTGDFQHQKPYYQIKISYEF